MALSKECKKLKDEFHDSKDSDQRNRIAWNIQKLAENLEKECRELEWRIVSDSNLELEDQMALKKESEEKKKEATNLRSIIK